MSWLSWITNLPGYTWLVPIDEEFIQDAFNMYGLRELPRYRECMSLIKGPAPRTDSAGVSAPLFPRAIMLLSQIHARFIVTSRGLTLMTQRYEDGAFGLCPRALCRGCPALPSGAPDWGVGSALLYCPCCQETYAPPRGVPESQLDGAFFGPTFAPLLLLVRPSLLPLRSGEVHCPTIFGFAVAAGGGGGGSRGGGGGAAAASSQLPAPGAVWSGRRSGKPLTTPWPDFSSRPLQDDFFSDSDAPEGKESGKKRERETNP